MFEVFMVFWILSSVCKAKEAGECSYFGFAREWQVFPSVHGCLPCQSWLCVHAGGYGDLLCILEVEHEGNYPTHDIELAVVVFALKIWRHCLYWCVV